MKPIIVRSLLLLLLLGLAEPCLGGSEDDRYHIIENALIDLVGNVSTNKLKLADDPELDMTTVCV